VHGAGHMVPATQPEKASVLFTEFLNMNTEEGEINKMRKKVLSKKSKINIGKKINKN